MATINVQKRLQQATQSYWDVRRLNADKQTQSGKSDAGTRGEVTGGGQMRALEKLVADILCEAGLKALDIRTRTALELPGHFRATKKWDLVVVSVGRLVMAMELKSQAGRSIGNNINNRSEEAVGSAKDFWTAAREGRFGAEATMPFLGYLFLLEDRDSVKRPVANKEPHFKVDPAFVGIPGGQAPTKTKAAGATYAKRYELLCRRLVHERMYSAACFLMATNSPKTQLSEPAADLNFAQFEAALRGHAVRFLGSAP